MFFRLFPTKILLRYTSQPVLEMKLVYTPACKKLLSLPKKYGTGSLDTNGHIHHNDGDTRFYATPIELLKGQKTYSYYCAHYLNSYNRCDYYQN